MARPRKLPWMGPILSLTCRQCVQVMDSRDFYAHPSGRYGRMSVCKDCHRSNVRENRAIKVDYYKEKDRLRTLTPERREQMRRYARTTGGRQAHARAARAWRVTHPEAYAALNARSAMKLSAKRKQSKQSEVPCS